MVVVPTATAVARPLLLITATKVFEEVQEICEVTPWRVESEYRPIAVNCWVAPAGMLGLAGDTTIPVSCTGPAHVVIDSAEDPINNIAKNNLIFFKSIPPAKKNSKSGLARCPIFRDPGAMLNRCRTK